MLLALAQLNPAVGNIARNVAMLRLARQKAVGQGADILMTSELYLCGYPPEDLVVKQSFHKALGLAVESLVQDTADGKTAILLGTPWVEDNKLYNAVLLLSEGKIAAKTFKHDLPNYGPFDEKRIFTAAPLPEPIAFQNHKLGVMICEDMWNPNVALALKNKGADILLVPNGSPYETDKLFERKEVARERVAETGLPLVYLNQLGGQDELVFDGASFALNASGKCIMQAKSWDEDYVILDCGKLANAPSQTNVAEVPESAIYNALMLGLRDYVNKNGFPCVVLGLSGGIDSALVAALAVDALGADKVWAVMMPSPYTSKESVDDATELAKTLDCRYDSIPITPLMTSFDEALAKVFAGSKADVTEENIQARCRGVTLMALSNKFGPMVLSTGNKSEMSVGYSTLYGDLCGGFAVLKDVYKTQVYALSRWRNAHCPNGALGKTGAIIPERIFTKAPTAELRPHQTDQDSLPPYDVLDDILECLIERDMGVDDIVARGHNEAVVKRVWSMLDRAEYKRRQAPPGVKITRRLLGKDRRYPITNGYKEK